MKYKIRAKCKECDFSDDDYKKVYAHSKKEHDRFEALLNFEDVINIIIQMQVKGMIKNISDYNKGEPYTSLIDYWTDWDANEVYDIDGLDGDDVVDVIDQVKNDSELLKQLTQYLKGFKFKSALEMKIKNE